MLDYKKDRLDYGEMLIPPEGYTLTRAVAATYSLDLNTLLSIPIALFYAQTLEGIGSGERVMDRLFDAFFTTKPDGVGLGLSISRSIIKAHCGELSAARNNPHGLTMTFSLPIQGQIP